MDVAVIAGIIMIISVVVMLVMGVPIGISIGMSSALAMITILPFGPGIVTCAQKMFTGVNSFSLLAIPFFILAGNIMNNGGIAIRLCKAYQRTPARFPGPDQYCGQYAVRRHQRKRNSRSRSHRRHHGSY